MWYTMKKLAGATKARKVSQPPNRTEAPNGPASGQNKTKNVVKGFVKRARNFSLRTHAQHDQTDAAQADVAESLATAIPMQVSLPPQIRASPGSSQLEAEINEAFQLLANRGYQVKEDPNFVPSTLQRENKRTPRVRPCPYTPLSPANTLGLAPPAFAEGAEQSGVSVVPPEQRFCLRRRPPPREFTTEEMASVLQDIAQFPETPVAQWTISIPDVAIVRRRAWSSPSRRTPTTNGTVVRHTVDTSSPVVGGDQATPSTAGTVVRRQYVDSGTMTEWSITSCGHSDPRRNVSDSTTLVSDTTGVTTISVQEAGKLPAKTTSAVTDASGETYDSVNPATVTLVEHYNALAEAQVENDENAAKIEAKWRRRFADAEKKYAKAAKKHAAAISERDLEMKTMQERADKFDKHKAEFRRQVERSKMRQQKDAAALETIRARYEEQVRLNSISAPSTMQSDTNLNECKMAVKEITSKYLSIKMDHDVQTHESQAKTSQIKELEIKLAHSNCALEQCEKKASQELKRRVDTEANIGALESKYSPMYNELTRLDELAKYQSKKIQELGEEKRGLDHQVATLTRRLTMQEDGYKRRVEGLRVVASRLKTTEEIAHMTLQMQNAASNSSSSSYQAMEANAIAGLIKSQFERLETDTKKMAAEHCQTQRVLAEKNKVIESQAKDLDLANGKLKRILDDKIASRMIEQEIADVCEGDWESDAHKLKQELDELTESSDRAKIDFAQILENQTATNPFLCRVVWKLRDERNTLKKQRDRQHRIITELLPDFKNEPWFMDEREQKLAGELNRATELELRAIAAEHEASADRIKVLQLEALLGRLRSELRQSQGEEAQLRVELYPGANLEEHTLALETRCKHLEAEVEFKSAIHNCQQERVNLEVTAAKAEKILSRGRVVEMQAVCTKLKEQLTAERACKKIQEDYFQDMLEDAGSVTRPTITFEDPRQALAHVRALDKPDDDSIYQIQDDLPSIRQKLLDVEAQLHHKTLEAISYAQTIACLQDDLEISGVVNQLCRPRGDQALLRRQALMIGIDDCQAGPYSHDDSQPEASKDKANQPKAENDDDSEPDTDHSKHATNAPEGSGWKGKGRATENGQDDPISDIATEVSDWPSVASAEIDPFPEMPSWLLELLFCDNDSTPRASSNPPQAHDLYSCSDDENDNDNQESASPTRGPSSQTSQSTDGNGWGTRFHRQPVPTPAPPPARDWTVQDIDEFHTDLTKSVDNTQNWAANGNIWYPERYEHDYTFQHERANRYH